MPTNHDGTEHLAFKDSRARRFLTILALHTTARFYSGFGTCTPISRGKIVKTGPYVHLTEAATMRFVAENTSIPVPKVYCAFVRKNRAYIVMERIQGEPIAMALQRLPEKSQQGVFSQLKRMIREMRALKPPPDTGVESCVGGSLCDVRMPRGLPRFGPFKTIQEFHQWLREGLQPSKIDKHACSSEDWEYIKEMVVKQDGRWPPSVFTHGDLNPCNILVHGDRVVAIIDWEFSGWYPHYWEHTSAWHGNVTKKFWQSELDNFLDPFLEELEMEHVRNKYWGEW